MRVAVVQRCRAGGRALSVGLVALGLAGCGAKGSISAFPTSLDWGIVDFVVNVPDDGFAVKKLSVQNNGAVSVAVQVGQFDFDRLCSEGWIETPMDLGSLEPGSTYELGVGVCGYDREAGERDTLVEGAILLESDDLDEPVAVPWSFTPTLDLGGDDTG